MSTLHVEAVPLDHAALEKAWIRFQEAGHVPTPFLSWQWISALRDVPEASGDMIVLVAREGTEIVGLLPVERTRDQRGLYVTGMAGRSWLGPDHSDVVAPPEHRPAVARALLGQLARTSRWDVLDLNGLRADGALAAAVPAVFRSPPFVRRAPQDVPISYVPLDGPIVSSHARKQVRKELRKAEASGGGFEVVIEPARFPPLLEEMMRLHTERFGSRSQVFATQVRRRFHHLAAQRLGAVGAVRMNVLVVDGAAAAITYHLAWDGKVLFYSGGLRPDLGRTPGFSVRVSAMLAAAEAGYAEADLLRGGHDYKDRFESVVRADVHAQVLRPTGRLAVAAAASAARRGRAAARQVVTRVARRGA